MAAVSDRGLRHHRNEDAFAVSTTALPDGTPARGRGGLRRRVLGDPPRRGLGRRVAAAASESLLAALPQGTHPQQAMHEAIVAAVGRGQRAGRRSPPRPASTPRTRTPRPAPSSASVVDGRPAGRRLGRRQPRLLGARRPQCAPARLTEDDSWAAQMVAAGLMSEAEAYADARAHAITGWLGADAYELEPHTASFKPDRPGVVVVCTDGLWNYAESAEEMAEAVPPTPPPPAAQRPDAGRPRAGRRGPRQRNSGRRAVPRAVRGRIRLISSA